MLGDEIEAEAGAILKGGRTPLHHAAYWGHKAAIEALLAAKADVHAQSDCGETPLHWAARMGQEAAIKALLAAKADVHAQNEGGRTPLHRAAYSGLEIKTFQAAKADGSAENHDDLGQEAAIRALLAAKADLNAKDIDGNTPLLLAVAYRQTSAAQVLREAGATA
ncbi:ankyrin repeat-containing domain protein [Baffinella frigidus]|nr:ankyrin repeat-containing domain protein [Cryptophyta sp. CCMP2293]